MSSSKEEGRLKRHRRIRKRITGTMDRPRLSVHRSSKNMFIQLIDDLEGKTLAAISTADKSFAKEGNVKGKVAKSEKLGELFGKTISEKGIKKIAFDRSGYLYHGRIKAFADALRKSGIQF